MWFVFTLNLSFVILSKNEADPLRKGTNFRLLQRQHDDSSNDVIKLTCMCTRGGHAFIPSREDLGDSFQVTYKSN